VTVVCADELGPVIPRTFPPSPGWSTDGHRIKAPLEYGRGREKTWVYGALRPGDGQAVTLTAPSRNSSGYQQLLGLVEQANPTGEIAVIADQPLQRLDPHLAGQPPAYPPGVHPGRGVLAQPPRGLVAHLPPRRPGRAVLRLPGRDHPRHRGGDLPAQRPRPPLDVGPPATVTPLSTACSYLSNLRNGALGSRSWSRRRMRRQAVPPAPRVRAAHGDHGNPPNPAT
jgi:hypothetical protein